MISWVDQLFSSNPSCFARNKGKLKTINIQDALQQQKLTKTWWKNNSDRRLSVRMISEHLNLLKVLYTKRWLRSSTMTIWWAIPPSLSWSTWPNAVFPRFPNYPTTQILFPQISFSPPTQTGYEKMAPRLDLGHLRDRSEGLKVCSSFWISGDLPSSTESPGTLYWCRRVLLWRLLSRWTDIDNIFLKLQSDYFWGQTLLELVWSE